MNPTYEDVLKAQSQRGDEIRKTPLTYSPIFSQLTGSKVYLKSEFQQKTGSFKIRGAYFKIKSLTEEEKKKGVITASAGNHAQGVAFASSLEKISCTIVMPKNASPAKVLAAKPSPGKKVVPILGGGNVDMYLLGQIVAKGLTQMGRLVKIFILLPDKPGALKELVDEIASLSVNIVEVVHDRLSSDIPAGSAGVTLSLETEGQKHADNLIEHLKEKNINFKILT